MLFPSLSLHSVQLTLTNPTVAAVPKRRQVARPANPCLPSPCGPLSQCRRSGSTAVCSCQPGYVSAPPTCRPECVVSSQCALDRACVNQKCVDPCPGLCARNARCQVVNHTPVCSCLPGYTGDPFTRCLRPDSKLLTQWLCDSYSRINTNKSHSTIFVNNQKIFVIYNS